MATVAMPARQSWGRSSSQLCTALPLRPETTSRSRPRSRSTRFGGEGAVAMGVGAQQSDLVEAQGTHRCRAPGVVDHRVAVLDDGAHHGGPAHAEVPGVRGVLLPTWRRPWPGPGVSATPGRRSRAVLGPAPHLAVGLGAAPDALAPHHHHPSPAAGRSRTRTTRRRLASARRPHADVSTICCSSPPTVAARRRKPSIPTSATALSLLSNLTRGLLDSCCLRQSQESRVAVLDTSLWRGAGGGHAPRCIARTRKT